jgi:hypothetical protein
MSNPSARKNGVLRNFDPQKAGNLELPETELCSELRRYSAKMAISVTHEERPNPGFYEKKQAGTLFFCLFKQIAELPNRRCSPTFLAIVSAFAVAAAVALHAQTPAPHPSFEVLTHRMDVDVDGAPNAYGPPGKPTLDILINAHYLGQADREIVGYLLDDQQHPILQGPKDPFPGYYISQTAFTDVANDNERDPRRYVDARNINYVVRGNYARRAGRRTSNLPKSPFPGSLLKPEH